MQSPALVRVSVESAARCGFTGCLTLRSAGGITIQELVVEVLKSITRKSGETGLDPAHFALEVDGQEITSVDACYGSKLAQLVRRAGPSADSQNLGTSSPVKRRASIEAAELKEKLDVLLHTEASSSPPAETNGGDEKWLDFNKDKKDTMKRLARVEQELETVHNLVVLSSELVNLEHERLTEIRATTQNLQRTTIPRISWRSAIILVSSGLILHALLMHFVVPLFIGWVDAICGGQSSLVCVAIGVLAATLFATTVRQEFQRIQTPLMLADAQPQARRASQASVRPNLRQEEQMRALAHVSALRARLPPNNLEDKALVRFLLARELNLDRTVSLVTDYLQWLADVQPLSIPKEEVEESFNSGKAFCFGMDKQRRPCVLVFARLHDKNIPLSETDLFQAQVMAPVCQLVESGDLFADEFVSIFDFANFGLSNFDVGALSKILSNLDKHYCEQLGKVYLINASTLFFALWKLITPFIPERTKSKIVILKSGQDFKSVLLHDFDASQLLVQHGGTASFVYDPEKYAGPVINR